MANSIADQDAREVLRQYPAAGGRAVLLGLGNRGGFSGARLWRVRQDATMLCLRAWPPDAVSSQRLAWIHRLMSAARSTGLAFVPDVLTTSRGATWVEHAGRLWELGSWMPGQADFHRQPTQQKMAVACTALAQLHNAWKGAAASAGPCPGIQRRLEGIEQWAVLGRHADRSKVTECDSRVQPWAERARTLLAIWAGHVPPSLLPLAHRSVPLQACLCDIWHDHVLFTGEAVTGLIDYGGVRIDHVAVDLARLLGSTAEDDPCLVAAGLDAYTRLRPLSLDEQRLVVLLDRAGTIVGLANWLKWLTVDRRVFEDYTAVAQRIQRLIERVERWTMAAWV